MGLDRVVPNVLGEEELPRYQEAHGKPLMGVCSNGFNLAMDFTFIRALCWCTQQV